MRNGIKRTSFVISLCIMILALFINAAALTSASATKKTGISGEGVVDTKYGKVKGVESTDKTYNGVIEFRSIPYAAPPVGNLRWKPPVEPAKWEGIRVCDKYAPMPMQVLGGATQAPYDQDFYWNGVPSMSEDCLYLNVFATKDDLNKNAKKPVYVWFHGGGLSSCYTFEPENKGEAFAKNGVILVMVEQRLGLFGYLSLPQLTKEQGQSGNYGLMDQIKALEWIRDNIANFGGDPSNITLGGQSGGTTKSMGLAISPKNDVPIKKLILQSGLKWTADKYSTQAAAELKGQAYLQDIGLAPDISLEALRCVDANAIMKTTSKNYPSGMCQDGLYLKDASVFDAVNAGKLDNIQILSGTNLGEGSYPSTTTAVDFYAKYKTALGDLYDKYDFSNLVKVTDTTAMEVSRTLGTYGLGTNGSRTLMANRLYGKLMTKRTNGKLKNYTYVFTHVLPESVSDLGTDRSAANQWAYHSSEMWYTFNSIRPGNPPVREWTSFDYELANQINQYWVNFLKYGDPNGNGLVEWPNADDGMGYIILGDGIRSHTGALTKLEQLMQEYTTRYFNISIQ